MSQFILFYQAFWPAFVCAMWWNNLSVLYLHHIKTPTELYIIVFRANSMSSFTLFQLNFYNYFLIVFTYQRCRVHFYYCVFQKKNR